MTAPTAVVASLSREWAIQIFSSSREADVVEAREALEGALPEESLHVQTSDDGVGHFLVVETRDDDRVVDRVRAIVESVGSLRLQHVHLPPPAPTFAREPRRQSSDDDRAA